MRQHTSRCRGFLFEGLRGIPYLTGGGDSGDLDRDWELVRLQGPRGLYGVMQGSRVKP